MGRYQLALAEVRTPWEKKVDNPGINIIEERGATPARTVVRSE